MINILIVILMCCCLSLLLGGGGFGMSKYVFQKLNDPKPKIPAENTLLYNGKALDMKKLMESSNFKKQVVENNENILQSNYVEKDKIYLINQVSSSPCENNVSYGLDLENKRMWVDRDCRGVFVFNNKIGYCGTYNDLPDNKKYCPLDKAFLDSERMISGFVEPQINFVGSGDDNSDKCLSKNSNNQNSYGSYGLNNMFSNNGCDGRFQIGSLLGSCTHIKGDELAVCPLGKTIKDVYGHNQGLFPFPIYVDEIEPNTCVINEDTPEQVLNYGVTDDGKSLWVDKGCKGDFSFYILSGKCVSNGERVECPIGSQKNINGELQGLTY
jgi:hypothetical protein